MGTIPYRSYLAAVERLYENNLGAMLRGLPHEAYLFQCGVCFALEQIVKLPDDLTTKARDLDARHPESSPDTAATDSGATVFTNTPFWDAYQRLYPRARQYGGAGVPVSRQRDRAPVSPGENGE
jgi:hypothetical protein